MNAWSMRVISNDQRENRLLWRTAQEGVLWRATLRVMPRDAPLCQDWEQEVTYVGDFFRTKRDAKEDACRLLLLAQQRAGRVPDLLPLGQRAGAQQAARGDAQLAEPEKFRPRVIVPLFKAPPPEAKAPPPVAKAPPPEAADAPPGVQQAPPPTPAAGPDPNVGLPPPGGIPGPLAGDPGGTRPSEAGPVSGSPDSDAPAALTARFLLPPKPPPPEPPTQLEPPTPERRGRRGGGDFLDSDSHSEIVRSDEEDCLASAEARQAATDAQPQAEGGLASPVLLARDPFADADQRAIDRCSRRRRPREGSEPRVTPDRRGGSEAWSPRQGPRSGLSSAKGQRPPPE